MSKRALAVTLAWGGCMVITLVVVLALILLVRIEALTWNVALPLSGVWGAVAATIVMWTAVATIHKLEREVRP